MQFAHTMMRKELSDIQKHSAGATIRHSSALDKIPESKLFFEEAIDSTNFEKLIRMMDRIKKYS